LKATTRIATLALLASCASGQKTASRTEAIESHVYARPLDDVLTETTALLTQQGWRVERSSDQLGTNWRLDSSGAALGYRVEGERVDDDHCSIRIEAVAATSFAPAPSGSGGPGGSMSGTPMYARDSSGGAGASGGRSTGWDGVDAPTTLGDPPPGMVTLPRGRDEVLEWALLQRLDPRAAQAIAHADARSKSAAAVLAADAGATVPLATGGVPPPPTGCEPELTGLEAPLADRRLVLLADVPGTNEIPDFVGRLACQAARKGVPTVVALELLRVDQDWVDTYFASQGSAADRAAFLQVTRSFDTRASGGRGSAAVLKLLDRLRMLRDAGLTLRVVVFDEAANAPGRGKARASTLERVRRTEPDALLLVVVERSQARTVLKPDETPAQAPLGWSLAHWGLKPLALDVRTPGGQTWSCPAVRGECISVPVPATTAPPGGSPRAVELYAAPDTQGFQGTYSVGPLTASSPPP
jgi:hypothetical protein